MYLILIGPFESFEFQVSRQSAMMSILTGHGAVHYRLHRSIAIVAPIFAAQVCDGGLLPFGIRDYFGVAGVGASLRVKPRCFLRFAQSSRGHTRCSTTPPQTHRKTETSETSAIPTRKKPVSRKTGAFEVGRGVG